ncbi:Dol-P-Man:Man(5)GlcNAc(2)-PP-Dol alpha-1,3-mannosyltransferase [Talaromyces atroroseus]|uniref:Dol-P-Man:Man(5)GlcNAc(2)-PP-Dol alpha-1,3-mannosyltransferase n=1 Tax=Talaromyces atroroseus TaxID=1441469 RepID=A0A1Q5Q7T6_TALAT|nr:Dol-P-Man:Man(5)GlcNAc(2)-PP-Dol alpha-1,3-mannosyltransferase [Talaromyces atroroseus]OKL56273.1 Dol-P-Man:Man(5)GlcNAc(2)-PP-Dol alpha-1,3-mannosyltransferase [Talaromyces atroroseus]
MATLKSAITSILTNPKHSLRIAPLLVLADALLSGLIISKVPYTEIDWKTYMQQIALYQAGERDYTAIKGDTGPLVYPAAHVYVYSFLYELTNQGQDIALGQIIFAGIYIATLIVVMTCYLRAGAPPYLLPLLVLSKRLHSVYMLRLFNDGVAAFFMWLSILLFQGGSLTPAVTVWSFGVGIKMSLLLLAPAVAIIVALAGGLGLAIPLALNAILVQVLLGLPFLQENAIGYLSRAFELTRQFLFEWTVNWRFVTEEVFESYFFSVNLLGIHAILVLAFLATRWIRPSGQELDSFSQQFIRGRAPRFTLSSAYVTTTLLTSIVIGMLCARSLHYQFFAYLAWATPFLLWQANLHPGLIYAIWAVQEGAWNVFPSTITSSVAVVACLAAPVVMLLVNDNSLHGPQDEAEETLKTK